MTAVDASNAALYDELETRLASNAAIAAQAQAQKDAADALTARNASIQSDIDALTKASMSLSDQRALEVKDMAASTLALYGQREALQAAAKAAADAQAAATALASTNAGYQQQIDTLLKATMSAADVREMETKGMDASTIALYDRLAGLKATAAADQAAADAIKKAQESAAAAESTRLQNIATARSALTSAYEAESSALKTTISQADAFVKSIRAFGSALLLGDTSPLSPQQRYEEARRQFETASPDDLQAASTAFLDASKAYNASGVQYAADFAQVQAAIDAAAIAATSQTNIAQQQLSALDASVAGLLDVKDAVRCVGAIPPRPVHFKPRQGWPEILCPLASLPDVENAA